MLVRSLVRHRRDISTFLNCARFWTIQTRDGHAEADDAEVCGLMRICAYAEAIRKTKSVCSIVGKKKTRSKIEQNWGPGVRAQKRLKFLTKIIKNLSKIGQKMGPKW